MAGRPVSPVRVSRAVTRLAMGGVLTMAGLIAGRPAAAVSVLPAFAHRVMSVPALSTGAPSIPVDVQRRRAGPHGPIRDLSFKAGMFDGLMRQAARVFPGVDIDAPRRARSIVLPAAAHVPSREPWLVVSMEARTPTPRG